MTQSGGTARLISKARPHAPILALSGEIDTLRRLALFWGVIPRFFQMEGDVDRLARQISVYLKEHGHAVDGERFIMTYGAPVGVRGTTSAIRVETVR